MKHGKNYRAAAELTGKAGRVQDLAEAIGSLLPTSAPEFGICHGDVVFANLRRDDRGRFTLFDFDCSGYGWRSYDVAISLWSQGFEFSRSANASRVRKWNAAAHRARRKINWKFTVHDAQRVFGSWWFDGTVSEH
jgi:Ser/Thr protein kinase RdoA (MazF antagonist)